MDEWMEDGKSRIEDPRGKEDSQRFGADKDSLTILKAAGDCRSPKPRGLPYGACAELSMAE